MNIIEESMMKKHYSYNTRTYQCELHNYELSRKQYYHPLYSRFLQVTVHNLNAQPITERKEPIFSLSQFCLQPNLLTVNC